MDKRIIEACDVEVILTTCNNIVIEHTYENKLVNLMLDPDTAEEFAKTMLEYVENARKNITGESNG